MRTPKHILAHRYVHATASLVALFLFVLGPLPLLACALISVLSFITRVPIENPIKASAAWRLYHRFLTRIAFPLVVIVLVVPYWGAPWYFGAAALVLVSTSVAMFPDLKSEEAQA